MRWSRQEQTYSALVKYRLDIWKTLKSSLKWIVTYGLIQPWSSTGFIKYLLSLNLIIWITSLDVFLRLTDDSFRCLCVHNIYNNFPLLCLTSMIYTLIYLNCFDILILLTFLIICLSDFINKCKSPVDIISETNLSVYNNKVSSQHSPDRKSPSFRTHAWDELCWSAGRQQSQNWIRRLVMSLGIVF